MRATLHRNCRSLTDFANRGETPPLELRLQYKFEASSVMERCTQLGARIYKAAGSSGLSDELPFGRIFNDPSDKIKAWGVGNAQVTLNAPDARWYVTGWVKNFLNKNNYTGEYLTSSTSGLYTNMFLGDPRTYGITAGVHL